MLPRTAIKVENLEAALLEKKQRTQRITDALARMTQTVKKQKQQSSQKAHSFTWIREAQRLAKAQFALERDIQQTMTKFATNENELDKELVSEFRNMLEWETNRAAERQQFAQFMLREITELRGWVMTMRPNDQSPSGLRAPARTIAPAASDSTVRTKITEMKRVLARIYTTLREEEEHAKQEISEITPNATLSQPTAEDTSSVATETPRSTASLDEFDIDGDSAIFGIDDDMRAELSSQLQRMAAMYREQLSVLEHSFAESYVSIDPACITNENAVEIFAQKIAEVLSPTGGWDEGLHFHFVKLFREYFSAQQEQGLATYTATAPGWTSVKEACLERMYIELIRPTSAPLASYPTPRANQCTLSKRDVREHLEWYISYRQYLAKRRSLKKQWAAERRRCIEHVRNALAEAARDERIQWEREAERRKLEQRRAEQHEQLQQMREEREKLLEQQHEREERERQEEQERLAREQQLREQERTAMREAVRAWLEQRREAEASRLAREREEELRQWEERRNELRRNRPKVERRAQQLEQKREQAAKRKEQTEIEKKRQSEKLQEFHERMQRKIGIEGDPERVQRQTEASKAAAEPKSNVFTPKHGYSEAELMAESRFKLAMKLREEGLHETLYAQKLLATMHSNLPMRRDNLTQEQRERLGTKK